jgi:hypothetical protein
MNVEMANTRKPPCFYVLVGGNLRIEPQEGPRLGDTWHARRVAFHAKVGLLTEFMCISRGQEKGMQLGFRREVGGPAIIGMWSGMN